VRSFSPTRNALDCHPLRTSADELRKKGVGPPPQKLLVSELL
jgi:hypothetical protein